MSFPGKYLVVGSHKDMAANEEEGNAVAAGSTERVHTGHVRCVECQWAGAELPALVLCGVTGLYGKHGTHQAP